MVLVDARDQFEPRHIGKGQVDRYKIGIVGLEPVQGLLAREGLTNDFNVRVRFQGDLDATSGERVILNHKYRRHRIHRLLRRSCERTALGRLRNDSDVWVPG